MVSSGLFFESLKRNGINFFTGVPDSLLKDFCAYVTENVSKENHIINFNEGAAIALASGYYLSTGEPALVYMQNSGLGNAVNPLLSLADKEVYGIPMLLMIGWRGEPGKKDEPQHVKQGRVMLSLLDAMEIPYVIINGSTKNIPEKIDNAISTIKKDNCQYALIISEGTFEKYPLKNNLKHDYDLTREDAIKIILDNIDSNCIIVSTTGKTSREVYEYRKQKNQSPQSDFLTVGSMGHCSQIALGISLKHPEKQIFIIDGDGAVLMHMGSIAINGTNGGENLKHIIINNGSHDSVGGQPTVGFKINFTSIAECCGYNNVWTAQTAEQIREHLTNLNRSIGPSMLEIKVNKGARENLGRPDTSPEENKISFMKFLNVKGK